MGIGTKVKTFILKLCLKVFVPSENKAFVRDDSGVIIQTSEETFQKAWFLLEGTGKCRTLRLSIKQEWSGLNQYALLQLSKWEFKTYQSIRCLNSFSDFSFLSSGEEKLMVSKITIIKKCAHEKQPFLRERFVVIFHLKEPDNSLREHKKVVEFFNLLFNEEIQLKDMRNPKP